MIVTRKKGCHLFFLRDVTNHFIRRHTPTYRFQHIHAFHNTDCLGSVCTSCLCLQTHYSWINLHLRFHLCTYRYSNSASHWSWKIKEIEFYKCYLPSYKSKQTVAMYRADVAFIPHVIVKLETCLCIHIHHQRAGDCKRLFFALYNFIHGNFPVKP